MTAPIARATYRLTAAALADLVSAAPLLERPLVRLGARVWNWRGAGRFYRSVADRYAERMRRSGSPFRRVEVAGIPLVVDVTEFTAATLFFGNVPYEPATTAFLASRLAQGSVFVDIGANNGYFTILAAALVGERGRVVAFEPNPAVFEQLVAHVRLNGFASRCDLRRDAIADAPNDRATLFVSQWPHNSGVSTLIPGERTIEEGGLSRDRTVTVTTDTFDRWFAASGLDAVDVVKIDTEGAEDLVVRGMEGTLRTGRVRAVICETRWATEAHRMLCDCGFVPQPLESSGPLTNIAYARVT